MVPLVLFLATCLSTFWTGAVDWKPIVHLDALVRGVGVFADNLPQGSPVTAFWEALAVAQMDWRQGLLYMGLVLGILVTHEMGHFVMTVRHHIPASLPYFIPLPVVPFGTLGAVIGMEGSRANRREMFDMGAAGPLAGLIVALPITIYGILLLPSIPAPGDSLWFHNPLIFRWLIAWLRPDYPTPGMLALNQFNAFLMAGWMGMLVTGLNMLPISQLDGGHVAYAVLGRRGAHRLARGLLVVAILFILAAETYFWVIMLVLVILLGTDHPPTANDRCRIGLLRRVIGWIALLIPIFCFPPLGITPIGQ
jgi:membrane-associated protease RseP (regulator of RpoE activity)